MDSSAVEAKSQNAIDAEKADLKPGKKVRILDDNVVNQIAAGEVVERPASVVKELVENSVDAGADAISVVIVNGGKSSIEVIDNGCGLSREDALLAIERFGTSKITNVDDLQRVNTLGFRGEALPSIASVSKFTLRSAASPAENGVVINIQGGTLRDVRDTQLPVGTRIEVKNLFFNVPARRSFLRSVRSETGLIKALLQDVALARPELRIRLISDGKGLLSLPPVGDFFERCKQLKLIEDSAIIVREAVSTREGEFAVSAMLSQPVAAVSSGGKLRLLVNGRSVRDRLMLRAVRDGYGNFLKPGRYPSGVLSLQVPFDEVDVNVHPQKAEVRFRRPDFVFGMILRSVEKGLVTRGIKPGVNEQQNAGWGEYTSVENESFSGTGKSWNSSFVGDVPDGFLGAYLRTGRASDGQEATFYPGEAPASASGSSLQSLAGQNSVAAGNLKLSQFRFVGQIFKLYLLMEGPETFAIVDMHAAHERVTFYRLKKQFQDGKVNVQQLLIPEVVNLPADRVEKFADCATALAKLGIECDRLGESEVAIRGLPALIAHASAKQLIEDLLSLPEWADWKVHTERLVDSVISRLACHGSVRSGRELETSEVYALLRDLEASEAAAFCPHGRPVVHFYSGYELEQLFGRAQ